MTLTSPYAYAKACGIISKSFIGRRILHLNDIRSLSDLDRMIFPVYYRDLPERELLADLENRIVSRAVQQILVIVESCDAPPELLIRMLRVYEYNDLKNCIQNIIAGNDEMPHVYGIGVFKTVDFDAFPDLELMVENTEFASVLNEDIKSIKNGKADFSAIEAKLDNHYYNMLLKSLSELPAEDRMLMRRIITDEISLRNCMWALRLRAYYYKRPAEVEQYLMDIKAHRAGKTVSLAEDAMQSLELPLDARSMWEGWKWEKLLNEEDHSMHWEADPRHFQNAASLYLYKLALRGFHRSPMSISAIFCFIKLKQFEEDLLTSVAEGLALGMDSAGVFDLLEVTT